jgi:hypothetical protein
LMVAFSLHLRSRVFVKAACGKTALAVWAADGRLESEHASGEPARD